MKVMCGSIYALSAKGSSPVGAAILPEGLWGAADHQLFPAGCDSQTLYAVGKGFLLIRTTILLWHTDAIL